MRMVDSNPRLAGFHLAPVIASSSRGPTATAPHGHIPRRRRARKEQNMGSFQHDMGFVMLSYHWDLCQGFMGFMSEN